MYKKPRLPKKEYFAKRINECREAGLTDKANYYQARLDELNKPSTMEFSELMELNSSMIKRWLEDKNLNDYFYGDKDAIKREFIDCIQHEIGSNFIVLTQDELMEKMEEFHASREGTDKTNKMTEDLLREFIDSHTKDLSRSIVATPTSECLDEFAMANQGSSDLLLVQMAKQHGAKLIIDELSNLINK